MPYTLNKLTYLSPIVALAILSGCGGGGGTTPTPPTTNQAPVFTSSTSATVAENQTSAITLTATDSDNNSLTYSISGTDASSFSVDATTGVVTFTTAPDFETKSSYSFVATVNDGTTTTNQNVTITISDVNETIPDTSNPIFTSASTFSVAENQTSGFTATATDTSSIIYSISGGTDASAFSINPTSGVVTFNTAPDYETKNSYFLIVTATDSSNNTQTQNVTVNVTDINETIPDTTPPTFTSNTSFNVAENQTSGFTAIATDSSAITYSISGTDASAFSINPTSGVVTFNTAPDYETKNSYSLIVTATDSSSNSATQNVTLNISDVDESSSGYLIDSAVQGVDYLCGTISGVTNSDGKFTYETSKCPTGIEFKLGSLSLGKINPNLISNTTTDKYLTIQELAGTTRDNITDGNVTKLAVLLQSLDDNNNSNDGIFITQNIKNLFTVDENLSSKIDSEISSLITTASKTEKDIHTALSHLLDFTKSKDSSVTTVIAPQDFNLTSVTGTALNTQTSSNTITIAGLTIPTYITISSGSEYKINNGEWKSTKSLVRNDDNITVRHTTANSLSGTTTTTLKIGGVTKTFGSTTRTTPPPPSKSLLRTGQTTSYATYDDGWYASQSTPLGISRTFTRDDTKNIVTDNATLLQWQDETTSATMNWANANTYCTDLDFGGYTDWRLPTVEELITIANKSAVEPSKFTEFVNIVSSYYWSSSTDASDTSYAWSVGFSYGNGYWDGKTGSNYVLCVRAGQ